MKAMSDSAATLEEKRGGGDIYSAQELMVGAALLLCAIVFFCFEIHAISAFNGWWLDELYSVWSSDPSLSFSDIFFHRILRDTNPPMYYSALFWTRRLIVEERTAIIFLNIASLAVALLSTSMASRRVGELGWALFAGAFFLLSGPVLRYTLEGRAYLMAMSATFVASWFCALAIQTPDRQPYAASFALVGLIAAMIHFYAALMCVCLAAGMVAISLFTKKKGLVVPGTALGLSACAATALYLPLALESVNRVRWTELSVQSLVNAYWQIRELAFGSRVGILVSIGVFVAGLMLPTTRKLAVAFGIAFMLFLVLPILVSLKKPIIGGRYWLIGAPAIVVFISFVTRDFVARAAYQARARLYWVGALSGLSFLVIADGAGFLAARADTANKLIWRGAEIAAPLLKDCPSRSVHVYTSWGFVPGFAFVAHVPEEVFTSVDAPATTWIDGRDSICPVLGWAEHILYRDNKRLKDDFVFTASNGELLQFLKIRAPPSEVDIYRHKYGFVVLRRGTLSSE
jgi:hypothetical protein